MIHIVKVNTRLIFHGDEYVHSYGVQCGKSYFITVLPLSLIELNCVGSSRWVRWW
jgi:hypothetical protein